MKEVGIQWRVFMSGIMKLLHNIKHHRTLTKITNHSFFIIRSSVISTKWIKYSTSTNISFGEVTEYV